MLSTFSFDSTPKFLTFLALREENTLNKDTRLLHKYNQIPNTITEKVDLAVQREDFSERRELRHTSCL